MRTNRRTLIKVAGVGGLASFAGCMGGNDDEDAITYMSNGGVTHDADEELMEEWAAETGVEVNHHVEPTEPGMITYLEQNPGAIDLLSPGASFLGEMVNDYADDPLVTEIDFDRLPNYEENVREEWREDVPFLQEDLGTYDLATFRYISSQGMVYNEDQVGTLEYWQDLQQPDLENMVALMDWGLARFGIASQMIEENINLLTNEDDEAEALFDRLSEVIYEQHPYVRNYWTSGDEFMQMYRNEAAYAGDGWGGRMRTMREEEGNDHLHFTHTPQGGISWSEVYCIPEASESKDHAYDLLNWLYEHDNIVELTDMNGYPLPINDQPDWISELPDYAEHPDDLVWFDWVNLPSGEINWFDRIAERFDEIKAGQWEP